MPQTSSPALESPPPLVVKTESKEPQATIDQTPTISEGQKPKAIQSEALAAFLLKFDLFPSKAL